MLTAFPDVYFNIDPKHWPAVKPLAQILIATNSLNRVCINSFSRRRTETVVRIIKEATGKQPATSMSALQTLLLGIRCLFYPNHAWQSPHNCILPPSWLLSKRYVAKAHAAELKILAWTVNDIAQMEKFLDMGVDGIVTDYPSRLKELLIQRNEWSSN